MQLARTVRVFQVYEIHLILEKAMDAMKNSPILLEVRCPVNICGDIHGQYGDLMRIFNVSANGSFIVTCHLGTPLSLVITAAFLGLRLHLKLIYNKLVQDWGRALSPMVALCR